MEPQQVEAPTSPSSPPSPSHSFTRPGLIHRASICLGSPSIMDRFSKSGRAKARPSTFSTFSVVGTSSNDTTTPRSPRFYQKLARWFKRKRGQKMASDGTFPMEKHGNTLHRAVLEPTPPPLRQRQALCSTTSSASQASNLALPHRHTNPLLWEISQESGYSSHHSVSACSSPNHSLRGRATNSPFSRVRAERFRFVGRTFKAGPSSLSEDIPEAQVAPAWYSRSQEECPTDGRRRVFQGRPEVFTCPVEESESSRPPSVNSSAFGSSVFSGSLASLPRSDTYEMVALTLGEFRIKHSELQFGKLLVGRRSEGTKIHLGRWHGDVVIHSSSPQDDGDVQVWLAEVRALAHVRHENLLLYMGACVEPPSFAIITSPVKAESLHTSTIRRGTRLSASGKLAILQQTANALSYLHAKGISHGRLSAHNIFLETKVKVSLLDYTPASLNLEYCSPEIAQRLVCCSPTSAPVKSPEGDVFAFGTLVYQLGTGRLPLSSLPAHSRLWLTATGALPSLLAAEPMASSSLARLVSSCWVTEPHLRPSFPTLCSLLQPARSMSKKLSTSEPRSLDRLGRPSSSGLIS